MVFFPFYLHMEPGGVGNGEDSASNVVICLERAQKWSSLCPKVKVCLQSVSLHP